MLQHAEPVCATASVACRCYPAVRNLIRHAADTLAHVIGNNPDMVYNMGCVLKPLHLHGVPRCRNKLRLSCTVEESKLCFWCAVGVRLIVRNHFGTAETSLTLTTTSTTTPSSECAKRAVL